jgi:hypothetical protein
LKIVLLSVLSQPFWITLRISRTTNDTDGLRLRAIPSLVSGLLAIVLMSPAAFAVVYPNWLTSLCGLVVYTGGSFGFMAGVSTSSTSIFAGGLAREYPDVAEPMSVR